MMHGAYFVQYVENKIRFSYIKRKDTMANSKKNNGFHLKKMLCFPYL